MIFGTLIFYFKILIFGTLIWGIQFAFPSDPGRKHTTFRDSRPGTRFQGGRGVPGNYVQVIRGARRDLHHAPQCGGFLYDQTFGFSSLEECFIVVGLCCVQLVMEHMGWEDFSTFQKIENYSYRFYGRRSLYNPLFGLGVLALSKDCLWEVFLGIGELLFNNLCAFVCFRYDGFRRTSCPSSL